MSEVSRNDSNSTSYLPTLSTNPGSHSITESYFLSHNRYRQINVAHFKTSFLNKHENFYRLDENVVMTKIIEHQHTNRLYNELASHLEYRLALIDWIKQINNKFAYCNNTFHLSCAILDTVFSKYDIEERHVKLVCFVSLHLAAKLHERDEKLLCMVQINGLFKNEFNIDEICNCETMMFKVLNYNADIQTPYTVMSYLLSKYMIKISRTSYYSPETNQDDIRQKFEKLASLFIDASLLDYNFYQFSPLIVSASAITVAHQHLSITPNWPLALEQITNLKLEAIDTCANYLLEVCNSYFSDELFEILNKPTNDCNKMGIYNTCNMSLMSTEHDLDTNDEVQEMDAYGFNMNDV